MTLERNIQVSIFCLENCMDIGLVIKTGNMGENHPVFEMPIRDIKEVGKEGQTHK